MTATAAAAWRRRVRRLRRGRGTREGRDATRTSAWSMCGDAQRAPRRDLSALRCLGDAWDARASPQKPSHLSSTPGGGGSRGMGSSGDVGNEVERVWERF